MAWKGRKGGPGRMLLLVLVVGVGLSIVSCGGDGGNNRTDSPQVPIPAPPASPTPPQTPTSEPQTPTPESPTQPPPSSPTEIPPNCPTPPPDPDSTPEPPKLSYQETEFQTAFATLKAELWVTPAGGNFSDYHSVATVEVNPDSDSSSSIKRLTIDSRLWGFGGCEHVEAKCNGGNSRIKGGLEGEGVPPRFDFADSSNQRGPYIVKFGFWLDESTPIYLYLSVSGRNTSTEDCWEKGPNIPSCPNN